MGVTALAWRRRGHAHVYGDDLPHDGAIVPMKVIPMRLTRADEAVPYLFQEHDPGFAARVRPGDFIVAGRNFGCGKPHTAGYLGMTAVGLSVLCASMPYGVTRALMNIGLPFLTGAALPRGIVTGDELEVDFTTGRIENLSRGGVIEGPPLDPRIRRVIEQGGIEGRLRDWLVRHPDLADPWPDTQSEEIRA